MNKREFYVNFAQAVREGILEIKEMDLEIDTIRKMIDDRKYTAEHVNKVLYPALREKQREVKLKKEKILEELRGTCEAFAEDMRRTDDLNPADLTDDIKLLESRIPLTKRDIDVMLERNSGNNTMTQLILRYCENNGIETRTAYRGSYDTIKSLEPLLEAARVSLEWADKDNVYDRLLGEGSEAESAFSEE